MNRWISPFGLRREQPEARRSKATVKLHLEELEDRALPSVMGGTVSQNENMTSQMASMWQQWTPVIAALQQDYFADLQMLGQEYAQAVSYAQYEAAQFLDDFISTFGNGAATTNTVSNQQPQPVTPPSGNGSMTSANNSAKPPTAKPLANGGPQVYFETSGTQIPESTGCMTNVTLGVFLSGPSTQTVSVYATTSDGSATQGIDYTAENEEVIFQPGQTVQTVSIPILDDGTDEDAGSSQYFNVTLNNPSGATLGNTSSCQVTIVENPQQGADDTLVWNPCPGSNDAAVASNWYDATLQQQLTNGQPGPVSTTPVILDGTPNSLTSQNAPIDWTTSFKVASITIQNGYNSQQTVYAGDTLEMDAMYGTTLLVKAGTVADFEMEGGCNLQTDNGGGEDDGTMDVDSEGEEDVRAMDGGKVTVEPNAQGSVQTVNGGVFNAPGNYKVATGDKVNVINGGTLNVSLAAKATQSSGGPINVTNGTLNIGDGKDSGNYSTFTLTSASADINIGPNGSMKVYQTGNTAIDNSANPGAVIANNGTVTLQGVTGANTTQISVPLQNHKTLNVNGGTWRFTLKDASGDDLSMDAGSINMTGNATIFISHAFTQTAGVLDIMDNDETIGVAVVGALENFNGGTIEFTDPIGYGVLALNNAVLNGATLNMRIQADSDERDLLSVGEKCTIKAGTSTINVTLVGTQTGYTSWTLIETNDGITGDFNSVNLPSGIFEEHPNNDVWACRSTD